MLRPHTLGGVVYTVGQGVWLRRVVLEVDESDDRKPIKVGASDEAGEDYDVFWPLVDDIRTTPPVPSDPSPEYCEGFCDGMAAAEYGGVGSEKRNHTDEYRRAYLVGFAHYNRKKEAALRAVLCL